MVIEKKGDTKEIHAYGIRDGKEVNLRSSGYGGMTFKMGGIELPLDTDKVDETSHLTNDPEAVEHYRAVGKFPESPEIEIEVKIAFPSKLGTGTASFQPYQKERNIR